MNLPRIFDFILLYWKSFVVLLTPIILLPVIIANDGKSVRNCIFTQLITHISNAFLHLQEFKCLYVVLMMAAYWVTEALPLPITSVIPIVLFPALSILVSFYLNIILLLLIKFVWHIRIYAPVLVQHALYKPKNVI